MTTKIRVGKALPLFRQIPDGDLTRVVKAILKDDAGDDLPSSPITLTHIGDAMHQHTDFNMPNLPRVFVSYQIFENDATTPTSDEVVGEVFEREIVSALGKQIIAVVDKGLAAIDSPKVEVVRGQDALIPIKFLEEELGDPFILEDADRIQFDLPQSDGDKLELSTDFSLGVAEVSEITTVADDSGNLGGKFFLVDTPNVNYFGWYNPGGGFSSPNVTGRTGVEISISVDDDADAVALATQLAFDALGDFSASVASDVVTLTNAAVGAVDDLVDGASPTLFGLEVTTPGVTPFDPTVEKDSNRSGVANFVLSQIASNSLRLGFNQDIRAIVEKSNEKTVLNLRNVLRVSE